ncbi:hypothetical protein D3C72_1384910 [compost metagenome]
MAAATRHPVAVQVIVDDGQARVAARPPGQPSHEEILVILRVVVFRVGASDLTGNAIGQGVVRSDVVAEIDTRFAVIERASGGVGLAETVALWPLGHEVDRAAGIGDAECRGIGSLQHLDALEGVGLFADAAEGIAKRQTVTIDVGIEPADLEEIEAVVRAVEIGGDASGVLQHLLDILRAALADFLRRDDGHRGGRVEEVSRHLRAAHGGCCDD